MQTIQELFMTYLPSFNYNGEAVQLSSWESKIGCQEETAAWDRRVCDFVSPDGALTVRVEGKAYCGYPVYEYRILFIGSGSENSGILSDIMSFDASYPLAYADCVIRRTSGTQNVATDFCDRSVVLADRFDERDLVMSSDEGRSCSCWAPYIGVDFDLMNGVDLAIGWTGRWQAQFNIADKQVRCRMGMSHARFYVKPGEELLQPSGLVFMREGCSVESFQTVIHDFMVAYKTPRDADGNIIPPMLPVTASGGNRSPEMMRNVIDYVAKHKMPFDVFWVDAGWQGPDHMPDQTTNCGNMWSRTVGCWRVNKTVHPDGLKGISDYAHKHGMKFLLWFEPERIAMDMPITKEHPEYLTYPPVLEERHNGNLVDLGNPEAWTWVFETVCGVIEDNGVDIYRQDFNMNPSPTWERADEPDRAGIHEIKHIAGLYKYWDALRERFPNMLLENCASGGRRMDFEMMSRSQVYCRSDYPIPRHKDYRNYQFLQGQNASVNTMAYVPFQGGEANPAYAFNDYELFSLTGSGVVFTPMDWDGAFSTREFSAEETAWFCSRFNAIDRMRKIAMGRFYPLTKKTSLEEDVWAGWQSYSDKQQEGYVVLFRRLNAPEQAMFHLSGIETSGVYELEELDGSKSTVGGADLLNLVVGLPEPRSVRLFFYRRKS